MRIKEVESLVGITKKNIRFYEQEGLLTQGRNEENSYREYGDGDVRRLKEIKLLRKLGMPIADIKPLLDERVSLAVAANRHISVLDGQLESISKSKLVCQRLGREPSKMAALDVDAYLTELERMEMEGAVFMNVKNSDVKKQYVGPVLACAVVILAMAALCVFFSWLRTMGMPLGLFIFFTAMAVIVAIGTIWALLTRIREIRGGEENDLGKY